MLDLFRPGQSHLHRMPAGRKLMLLFLTGTLLFMADGLPAVIGAAAGVVALYRVAGFGLDVVWQQLRPVAWILVLLFAVQALIADLHTAGFTVLRLAVLLSAAGLLTLTTRASDMIAAITSGLSAFRPLGVNPEKVGLAFSLALRFIPVLGQVTTEVREAQSARGQSRNIVAVAIPVVVRTLKMADAVSEALDARGYDP